MASDMQVINNGAGQAVYLAGKFPDGTFGIMIDQARPFTELELANPAEFKRHADDLAKRVDEDMRNE